MDIVWNITGRCNFECVGCWDEFKDKPELSAEQSEELIKKIAEQNPSMLLFTGGEPLMRTDIFALMKLGKTRGIMNFKICTNGVLISKKMKHILESPLTEIHVSLDDTVPGGFHDHAELVLANLREFAAQGGPRQIKTVLMASLELGKLDRFERVLNFAREYGFKASYQLFCQPYLGRYDARAVECAPMSERCKFFQDLEALLRPYSDVLDFFSSFYLQTAKKYLLDGVKPATCAAGSGFGIVSPAGESSPCYYLKDRNVPVETCFSSKCMVWFRAPARAQRLLQIIEQGAAKSG